MLLEKAAIICQKWADLHGGPFTLTELSNSKVDSTSIHIGLFPFSRIVHGPSTIQLPHMGLVQDGTKCGEGLMCMGKNCVPVTTLPPLECPGTKDGIICSGHGVSCSLLIIIKREFLN